MDNKFKDPLLAQHDSGVNFIQAWRLKYLWELQKTCKHENIAWAPYRPSDYIETLPSMRVCLCCGLCEDEWKRMYYLTNDPIKKVSREEAYNLKAKNGFWLKYNYPNKYPIPDKNTLIDLHFKKELEYYD